MIRKFIFAFVLMFTGLCCYAEGYNILGVSYTNTYYHFNDDYSWDINGIALKGGGISYLHGFMPNPSIPGAFEIGLNINFGQGTSSESEETKIGSSIVNAKYKLTDINVQIPVNVAYKISFDSKTSLTPYIGVDFKLHMLSKMKSFGYLYTPDSNDSLEPLPTKFEEDWSNLFDKNEMGGSQYTYNRFQLGWHIGLRLQYDMVAFGVQYGTDFIPAYNQLIQGVGTPKVNTSTTNISLAFCF